MKYTYIAGILFLCAIVAFGSFTFGNMKIQKQEQTAQVASGLYGQKSPVSSASFKEAGKEGCMDQSACNFDKTAKVAGICTYAVFDAQAVHKDAETCTLSKSVKEVEKPSKVSPFTLLPPEPGNGCEKVHRGSDSTDPSDDNIGQTFNVHLHQWKKAANGQVLSRSTSFYRVVYSADGDISDYAGTNACGGLKLLKPKKK